MVEGINIAEFSEMEFYNNLEERVSILSNLKKVNIFIGENNCGKSRLMRSFVINELTAYSIDYIKQHIQSIYKSNFNNLIKKIEQLEKYELNEIGDKIKNILSTVNEQEKFYKINDIYPLLEKVKYRLNPQNYNERRVIECIAQIKQYIEVILSHFTNSDSRHMNKKNIVYVPILRGIENFELYFEYPEGLKNIKMTQSEFYALEKYKNNAKSIYKNKVSSIYKIPSSKIFTAEDLYDDITNKLLGDEKSRNFVRNFEKFISNSFYDDIEFAITPNKTRQYLGIKIGDNCDRALYDLGEGIKQLIVLFYKIFEQKGKETIFLIEEPELNLHPGFQRKLMEIITKDFPEHQFFITTHSNHIIDLYNETDNISLYKFRNADKSNSKFYLERVLPKDATILDEIGAKNSSVFMSNCTIWVEGISDKIYISKYLELYFKENNMSKYKEDIHYSFVEYGGNNIEHWSFIDDDNISTINASSITHNVFMICDNDNGTKHERKNRLKNLLGDRLYILKSREIENLLSKKVLEATLIRDNRSEMLEYKKYNRNGYDESNYARPNVRMAEFIDNTYKLGKKYSDAHKALKNKSNFAKKAIEEMNSYDDLSEEAKDLTEKIINFIKNNN